MSADTGGLNPPSCGFKSRPGYHPSLYNRHRNAMKKNRTVEKRGHFPNKDTVIFNTEVHIPAVFDDSYVSYMSHIIRYPRLTPKREAELSRIVRKSHSKTKVEAAVTEFVEGNLLLVVKCAIEYYRRYIHRKGTPLTLMDLIAEGNFGLLKAAGLYDSDHKAHAKFGTYAVQSIKRAIRRAVQKSVQIHVPLNHYVYWPAINRLKDKYGDDIPDEALAEELGTTVSAARLIMAAKCIQPTRLDANPVWESIVPDSARTDDKVNLKVLGVYLAKVMDEVLTSREKKVMYELYLSGKDPTYDEVGEGEGVSRERVRQISTVAMRKMRRRIVGDWERTNRLGGIKVPICVELFSAKDKWSTKRLIAMKRDLCRGKDLDSRDRSLIESMIF